jgi:hypothetical protein
MDKISYDQAKEIAQSFLQTYYQYFDNGPRDNLMALYVYSSFQISCFLFLFLNLKLGT